MLCDRLKKIRILSGLTQQQVADHLHMCQNTYSRIETGKSKFNAERIPELCRLFNVEPNFFYEDELEKKQVSEE